MTTVQSGAWTGLQVRPTGGDRSEATMQPEAVTLREVGLRRFHAHGADLELPDLGLRVNCRVGQDASRSLD